MSNLPKLSKLELAVFLVAAAIAGFGLYYFGSAITGFVVKESGYSIQPNLVVTSGGNYTFGITGEGSLSQLSIDGRVTNYGRARVYLESNGVRYLVFDSAKLNAELNATEKAQPNNSITGFVVGENKNGTDKDKEKANKKPHWAGAGEFVINGTTLIELSQYFGDEDNDTLIYSSSQPDGLDVSVSNNVATITPISDSSFNTTIVFTASDGINSKSEIVRLVVQGSKQNASQQGLNNSATQANPAESANQPNASINTTNATGTMNATEANMTQPANETANETNESAAREINQTLNAGQEKTISINLSYKPGTIYDANDNGEESINGIIDMTVEATKFSWDVNQSRLCTRWEVYSIDDRKLTTLCNGNPDCCGFIGLLPGSSNWSDVYYAAFGKDGAGYSNTISSQVLYYDVNLSPESPKYEIYNSGWGNLSARFFDDETPFSNECIDTCLLAGLNKSSYILVFELEGDAVLRIDKIRYSVLTDIKNSAPVLLKNFSMLNVPKNGNATINLSEYFADADGDALTYGYYNTDNITILFGNNTAAIVPEKGFEGIRFTYITANDSESSVASNVFGINVLAAEITSLPQGIMSFEVRDKNDKKLAVFDSLGNVAIRGNFAHNVEPIADENDFVVQDSSKGLNLVVKNPEGNMMIKGLLNENQSLLVPTPDSFIILNKDNEVVAYVNSTGSLFLKGTLTENSSFG